MESSEGKLLLNLVQAKFNKVEQWNSAQDNVNNCSANIPLVCYFCINSVFFLAKFNWNSAQNKVDDCNADSPLVFYLCIVAVF